MRRRLLFSLLPSALLVAAVLGAPTPAGAAASDWSENPESKVRLITPYRVAPVGQEVWLGLHFELPPEWHVYWKNSGDAGFPPVIDLESTPELGDAELLWPAPERYELPGDLVAFGYEDEVVYPIRARLGDGVSDPLEIVLVVDYLVCKIDCIPYRYTLRLEQPTGPEAVEDPETAPLLARWRSTLPLPVAEVAGVETRGWLDLSGADEPVLEVTVTGAEAAEGAHPELFLESHELYDLGKPALEEIPDGLRYRVALDPLRALDEPPASATFAWTVTGLALPDGTGAIEARQTVPAGSEPPADAETGEAAAAAGASYVRLFARALLGGLVLALTPAALALILLVIGDLRYGRGTGTRVAATTAGAVAAALSLAAAGFALGVSGAGGWNALLQRPLAVTALALVALGFALRLWGFAGAGGRTLPEESSAGALAARSFGFGLLLPLLALPWPVPPAPGAVDGAMAAGTATGLAAAALAALGLALPLTLPLILAETGAPLFAPRRRGRAQAEIIAAGRRSPWREALGFLAALSVVWLLYVLSGLVASEDLAFVELSLLGVGLAGWALRRASDRGAGTTGRVWMLLAAAAAGAALWIAATA